MERRAFLRAGSLRLLAGWVPAVALRPPGVGGASWGEAGPYSARAIEESHDYRVLGRAQPVDWVAIELLDAPEPAYRLQLIDLTRYPDDDGMTLTVPIGPRCVEVVIPPEVPYSTLLSWSPATRSQTLGIFFDGPAAVGVHFSMKPAPEIVVSARPLSRAC